MESFDATYRGNRTAGTCRQLHLRGGDAHWFALQYGGEERMEGQLPALHHAWRKGPERPVLDKNAGFMDDAAIESVRWDGYTNSLLIRTAVSLTRPVHFLDEVLEVFTQDCTRLAVLRRAHEGVQHMRWECHTTLPAAQEIQGDHIELDYTVLWADQNSGGLCGLRHSRDTFLGLRDGWLIKDIHVEAPLKKNGGQPPINVCYNRKPVSPQDVDYTYPESWNAATKRQQLLLPVKGWAEFREGADTFESIDPATFILKLDCQSGVAKYTKTGRAKELEEYFTARQEPRGVSFQLEEDWLESVPAARLPVRERVDFYFSVELICRDGRRALMELSSTLEQPYPGSALVGWLNLLWGCLEENTLVLLGDGQEVPVCRLQVGDMVRTPQGADRVMNCVQGTEKELLAVQLEDGKILYCTEQHPVFTARGPVPAGKLTGEDVVCTLEGSSPVRGLWTEKRAAGVFNLILEQGQRFYAGGILVGDNELQGRLASPARIVQAVRNPFAGEQDIKRSIWEEIK